MSYGKQRLAIFLPALYGGGAERSMLNLAHGLADQGHTVDMLLARAEGPYLRQVPDSVRLVELNSSYLRDRKTIASIPALIRYLQNEQPVVLVTAMYANLIALWSRRVARVRTRVVIVEQNTFSCSYQQLPKWYGCMMQQLVRWSYPNADAIVAVSAGVANDLATVTGINGRRIRVIYNPVITPELRRKALVPPNHPWLKQQSIPVILSVGRLTPQKDYPNLLRAFASLRQKRPVRLLILGEGPERSALETIAKQLGIESDIHLPGFAENPYPMMAGASVYVLSSRWEGLPTVLIEALYCGTPVVATNCPSGPSEILLGGKYGTLVDVGDSSALAQAIAAVLDSERVSAPQESWLPFDSDTVLRDYSDVMFGE